MTGPSHGNAARLAVTAQLSVPDGRAALDFYCSAFGAAEIFHLPGETDEQVAVAQLAVGDASFWLAEESPENRNFSPQALGGSTVRMLLMVDDPQALIDRAVTAGAELIYPAKEGYGWLLGRVEDPFGHVWEIGKPLMPWPPGT